MESEILVNANLGNGLLLMVPELVMTRHRWSIVALTGQEALKILIDKTRKLHF